MTLLFLCLLPVPQAALTQLTSSVRASCLNVCAAEGTILVLISFQAPECTEMAMGSEQQDVFYTEPMLEVEGRVRGFQVPGRAGPHATAALQCCAGTAEPLQGSAGRQNRGPGLLAPPKGPWPWKQHVAEVKVCAASVTQYRDHGRQAWLKLSFPPAH